jgi:hypothetical protein
MNQVSAWILLSSVKSRLAAPSICKYNDLYEPHSVDGSFSAKNGAKTGAKQ